MSATGVFSSVGFGEDELVVTQEEIAAVVIAPHFDAVRDVFAEFEPEEGKPLRVLRKTRFIVDSGVHDSNRHFAGCRQDGMLVQIAPEAARLPVDTLVAIFAHEMGHAADFAYPGCWLTERDGPARWLRKRTGRGARAWMKAWSQRSDDQMEWDADSIAWAVVGRRIGYCGPCALQCFDGRARPEGLR